MDQNTTTKSNGLFQLNDCTIEVFIAKEPTIKTVDTKNGQKQVANARGINHQGADQLPVTISAWDEQAVKLAAAAVGSTVKLHGSLTLKNSTNPTTQKTYTEAIFRAKLVTVTRKPKAKAEAGAQDELAEAVA